jgi:hypothetical protein
VPNADQEKAFWILEERYRNLRVALRTLIPADAYHEDAEPLTEDLLLDVQMIGEQMRTTLVAMEAILCTPRGTPT